MEKKLVTQQIIKKVEKGSGLSLFELKKTHSEKSLFFLALKYVTTTKKCISKALNIPIEAACRYKRCFEEQGGLVQSTDKVYCPFTKKLAHLITTNTNEFETLLKSSTNQLKLF